MGTALALLLSQNRFTMINQYEASAIIADELPEIKEEIKNFSPELDIFKSIQCLTNFTSRKLKEHNLLMVKRCFKTAEEIYCKGNTAIKNAIENVFIFSFPAFINVCDKEERNALQAIMPLQLYSVYIQQVLKSGI